VRGDQQLVVSHPRRSPVRWWTTFATGDDQQRPSPDSWPVRAASAIAATIRSASASSTTNVRSAFGRKRDSNVRPRYSWVTPRSRPCPIASRTVTPTWPVSSSTASITVSTRSLTTTASTLTIRLLLMDHEKSPATAEVTRLLRLGGPPAPAHRLPRTLAPASAGERFDAAVRSTYPATAMLLRNVTN